MGKPRTNDFTQHQDNGGFFNPASKEPNIMVRGKKKNNLPRKYYLTILGLIIAGSIILVILQT